MSIECHGSGECLNSSIYDYAITVKLGWSGQWIEKVKVGRLLHKTSSRSEDS